MGRLLRIALVMLVPLALVIIVALSAYKPGPPDKVVTAVYGYLRYQESSSQQAAAVQQIVHAGRPQNLTLQMSKATFGDSVYYQTTYGFDAPGGLGSRATATPWPREFSSQRGGVRPMPFPPVDVWCVLLRQADKAQRVVFVAEHQDLYNADWILHEPSAESQPELNAILSSVGCDLVLDR
jgi:hypothetical protein